MKCNNFIMYKKGTEKILYSIEPKLLDNFLEYVHDIEKIDKKRKIIFYTKDDFQICDGNIQINVKAIDEPYFGGHSATLEVEYICNKCKAGHVVDWINDYNINEKLQEILDTMESK